jgi:hypothetical protein
MPWKKQLGTDAPFSGNVGPDGSLHLTNQAGDHMTGGSIRVA